MLALPANNHSNRWNLLKYLILHTYRVLAEWLKAGGKDLKETILVRWLEIYP